MYIISNCFYNQYLYIIKQENTNIKVGDFVIISDDKEIENEIAKVIMVQNDIPDSIKWRECNIIKKALLRDIKKFEKMRQDTDKMIKSCYDLLKKNNINKMYIVDSFVSSDDKKISFLYTSDVRIEFSNIVSKLASFFKKKIFLKQIGVRERAKNCGGCGSCGRELCCKKHLKYFKSINSDMAKVQGVFSRGRHKISGHCGKLKCCLIYEADDYKNDSKKNNSNYKNYNNKNKNK